MHCLGWYHIIMTPVNHHVSLQPFDWMNTSQGLVNPSAAGFDRAGVLRAICGGGRWQRGRVCVFFSKMLISCTSQQMVNRYKINIPQP